MSQTQVAATSLLCDLMESETGEINGHALQSYPNHAGVCLLQEKMLVFGRSRSWVKCPECRCEQARVVRDVDEHQVMLHCPECLDVTADMSHTQTHKVSMSRFISVLLVGLDLSPQGLDEIEPGTLWKLGITQKGRGKPVTWYFARRLNSPRVAERLRRKIRHDNALESCTVITSSKLPLGDGNAMDQLDVRCLSTLGRLGKSTFHVFSDRLESDGFQVASERKPRTTLKYLNEGVAYVEGERIELNPMQVRLLQALVDDLDHEMTREELKEKCGSQAQRFTPVKVFQRKELVYRTFVQHLQGDAVYQLISHEGEEFFD